MDSEAVLSGQSLVDACDATFELDSDLLVVSEEVKLAGLLQLGADRSLRGTPVLRFVVDKDRRKFSEWARSSFWSAGLAESIPLQTQLRDGVGNLIDVDVFVMATGDQVKSGCRLFGAREVADTEEQNVVGPLLPLSSMKEKRCRSTRAGSGVITSQNVRHDSAVAIWFDISTTNWSVVRSLGNPKRLWGSSAGRAKARSAELVSWITPTEQEEFIEWAQEAYCQIRTVIGAPALPHTKHVHMRLPAFRHREQTCHVAVTLSLPAGKLHNKHHVQLTFEKIAPIPAASGMSIQ